MHRIWPGGLRSLAAAEVALGLDSHGDALFDQRDFWHATRLRGTAALQAGGTLQSFDQDLENRCCETVSPAEP